MVAHNEHRLLSRVIKDGSLTPLLDRHVVPEWFTQDEHRRMAEFLMDWNSKYGQCPSPQAVKANVPGYRLLDVSDPVESMLDALIARKRQQSVIDAVKQAASTIAGGDHESAIRDLRTSLGEVEKISTRVTTDMDLVETADQRFDWYEQVKNRPNGLLGLPTGFPTIDQATAGVQPEQLITLIASAKVGKSISSLQVAANVHGHPSHPSVMFQSFEMSNSEQQTRHDAMRAHISHSRLRRGELTPDEEIRYQKMLHKMSKMPNPLHLTDAPEGTTVSGLSAKIEELGTPDFIVVDGVYLMIDEITGESSTAASLTNITRGLKRLAKKVKRPIFITTQALQWKMSKTRLSSSSVGYSSSFVQDSDVVLGLEKIDDEVDDARLLRVIMSRNCGPVETYLRWDFEHGRFEEEV